MRISWFWQRGINLIRFIASWRNPSSNSLASDHSIDRPTIIWNSRIIVIQVVEFQSKIICRIIKWQTLVSISQFWQFFLNFSIESFQNWILTWNHHQTNNWIAKRVKREYLKWFSIFEQLAPYKPRWWYLRTFPDSIRQEAQKTRLKLVRSQ